MRVLVTGAAGFIGSTYVRIAGEEHDIVVLDKLTYAGRPENLPEGTPLIEGAIEDPKVVREAMEDVRFSRRDSPGEADLQHGRVIRGPAARRAPCSGPAWRW